MPVLVDKLVQLLKESESPEQKIQELEAGFRHGFDIGYEGPEFHQSSSVNIPFTVGNKIELWNKLMKEVQLKRVAGPYDKPPFTNFMQSPIGLVPKAGGKTKLIFHLSYNFDKKGEDGKGSLNHHTPRDKCVIKYRDLDYAVSTYLKLAGITKETQGKQTNQQGRKQRRNKTIFGG